MVDFTFILPCLNEEKTLPFCIDEIKKAIEHNKLNAEILVSDNDSEDKSREVAESLGARVCICKNRGYGNALINGTKNAYGKYCVMGDCDGSYDFYNISQFIEKLNEGYDMVVGNRYAGGIQDKAMPLSHRIGVKFLSGYANFLFHTPVKDFHCGLRMYNTEKLKSIDLQCPGMEYASEMIIKAKINNLSMCEVPTVLRKDLRDRKPHLKTIRDGFRHLFLITKMFIHKKKYKVLDDKK
ncbi:MAG: glycosyltransferase family 2 protein [Clostridia bacterium]|nr:glycosyltransferase family 2 protein [Clostridia bacterium]